ncbi:carbohydrate-binding module family 1 protein [Cylindrobasidium torrendii FP15055 ss-10]|uniref:Glucanase n=1 Tax=Cylindrobasidium torrendii FP15055 ss-10 TaxID=1314674 RepID=A0A0D7BD92_9AGAR|nr:carbohydrate-binding module family 1 protein [Cylindrobasidium torrendii FP15055 ss-10]
MFNKVALIASTLFAVVYGQQVGTLTTETHPSLPIQSCSASGCTTESTKITLDANWRWLHSTNSSTNCYTGNEFDTTLCPDPKTCTTNCALDGADYSGTYGITVSGNALTLKFVTKGQYSTNIGSRVYLLQDESTYKQFSLLNKEFTFDVDVSNLPCGLNGAVYFAQMDADGGVKRFPTNKAGAKYGTGYCDAQCPHDVKFINGEANVLDWVGSANDTNAGTGRYGTCCPEMDIWEANSVSTAYTPHPCSVDGQTRCEGTDCGDGDNRYAGVCDKDGCDYNSYRQGDKTFFGPGKTVDSTKKLTLVTQFITDDGTDTGDLSEIRRFYVQNGKVIPNSYSTYSALTKYNSISESYCTAQKTLFGDTNSFEARGGLAKMGDSIASGMTLVLSLWDDHAVNMLWLDSTYPTTAAVDAPGVARGTCATTSGDPKDVEANSPNASVVYSNIKYGALNSTFAGGSTGGGSTSSSVPSTPSSSSSVPSSSSTASPGGSAEHFAQCGGTGWTGPTACVSPYTCTAVSAPYYYQCL